MNELEPDHGFKDVTIRTHIAIHSVANKKPDPLKHRKLYANPDGTYRLYWSRDPFHPERKNGKVLPDPNRFPAKYHEILARYRAQDAAASHESEQADPILSLRGVGKEIWRDLGGGDRFIRELRENWFGAQAPAQRAERAKPKKRKRVV